MLEEFIHKQGIYPHDSLFPTDYIIYEEKENNYVPIIQEVKLPSISILSSEKEIKLSKENKKIKEKDQILKYISDEVKEVADNLLAYLRMYSTDIAIEIYLVNKYMFDNIIIDPEYIENIHYYLTPVTVFNIFYSKRGNEIPIEQILFKLGLKEAVEYDGFSVLYLPYGLYNLEKIKKDFTFSKTNLMNLLDQNKVYNYKVRTYKDTHYINHKTKKIVHNYTMENKRVRTTTQCRYKNISIENRQKTLFEQPESTFNLSEIELKIICNDPLGNEAHNVIKRNVTGKKQQFYKLSFSAEILNETSKNTKLMQFIEHIKNTEEIITLPWKKRGKLYETIEDPLHGFTITFKHFNSPNEIEAPAFIPIEFKNDLDIDLSLKIIDTICNF